MVCGGWFVTPANILILYLTVYKMFRQFAPASTYEALKALDNNLSRRKAYSGKYDVGIARTVRKNWQS